MTQNGLNNSFTWLFSSPEIPIIDDRDVQATSRGGPRSGTGAPITQQSGFEWKEKKEHGTHDQLTGRAQTRSGQIFRSHDPICFCCTAVHSGGWSTAYYAGGQSTLVCWRLRLARDAHRLPVPITSVCAPSVPPCMRNASLSKPRLSGEIPPKLPTTRNGNPAGHECSHGRKPVGIFIPIAAGFVWICDLSLRVTHHVGLLIPSYFYAVYSLSVLSLLPSLCSSSSQLLAFTLYLYLSPSTSLLPNTHILCWHF